MKPETFSRLPCHFLDVESIAVVFDRQHDSVGLPVELHPNRARVSVGDGVPGCFLGDPVDLEFHFPVPDIGGSVVVVDGLDARHLFNPARQFS